jgi:signal transduction histidine kinase
MLAELHDGVTASLSRALLLLGNDDQPRPAPELHVRARDAVREGLAEARTMMTLMDGGVASWDGVVEDLRAEVSGPARAFSLPFEFTSDSDGSTRLLSALEKHTMRRVVREAVTNAVKHGKPTSLHCAVTARRGQVVLRVSDDSARAEAGAKLPGRGLRIAERRLQRLGGTLSLSFGQGGGATVEATFPLELARSCD